MFWARFTDIPPDKISFRKTEQCIALLCLWRVLIKNSGIQVLQYNLPSSLKQKTGWFSANDFYGASFATKPTFRTNYACVIKRRSLLAFLASLSCISNKNLTYSKHSIIQKSYFYYLFIYEKQHNTLYFKQPLPNDFNQSECSYYTHTVSSLDNNSYMISLELLLFTISISAFIWPTNFLVTVYV